MFTEQEKRKELLKSVKEPFLHIPLAELNAIEEIKVKEEKNHVSVKVRHCKNRHCRTNAASNASG